ncbi:MAG: hypothetical protein R2699_19150 [Acidimicrobiales bacterium]
MTYTRAELEAMAGELHMDGGFGGINPTIDQLVELFERGGDGPVQMINLLKFKPRPSTRPAQRTSAAPARRPTSATASTPCPT